MKNYINLVLLLLILFSQSAFNKKDSAFISIPTDEKIIYDVCYSLSGNTLIAADGNKIKWFSTDDYSLLSTFSDGHNNRIMSLDLSPDSTLLVSGGKDSSIVIWDVVKGRLLNQLTYHQGIVTSVKISKDGNYIISGGTDKKVFVFDIENDAIKYTLSDHTDDITSVAISPDGRTFCSAGGDGKVIFYDVEKGNNLGSISRKGWVREVSYSQDGSKVISGGDNSVVEVWTIKDLANIRALSKSYEMSSWILSAKFHEDNSSYAIGGMKGVANISSSFGEYMAKVGAPIHDIEFKPNNGTSLDLALATHGEGIIICNGKNMRFKKR